MCTLVWSRWSSAATVTTAIMIITTSTTTSTTTNISGCGCVGGSDRICVDGFSSTEYNARPHTVLEATP